MNERTNLWTILLCTMLCLTVCVGIHAAPCLAQGAGVVAAPSAASQAKAAQSKLMACRAARADAIRKLAERIKGLQITSATRVQDFVAESDAIDTYLRAHLNGVKEVGKPVYAEDGTCEVTMEVKLKRLVTTLKKAYKEHYTGDKLTITDIEKIAVTNKIDVIRETGSGVVAPWSVQAPASAVAEGNLQSISHLGGPAKAYWLAHCTGRGRLMAVRAARVDAMRRLGERIKGVMITSQTSVRDFVAESDQINLDMRTFLRGAKETHIRYHDEELIVEVEMAVKLRELMAGLKKWGTAHYKGNKVKIKDFEKLTLATKDKVITETGMGVPPEKYLKNIDAAEQAVLTTAAGAPPWATQTLRVVGESAIDTANTNAAQAKLMAKRGAELDARRKLAERINGLQIASKTSVRDFVTAADAIDSAMSSFQQGAYVIDGSEKFSAEGLCSVTVEIDLKPLWEIVLHYHRTIPVVIE